MTSIKTHTSRSLTSSFSLIFHLASVILLIGCVCSMIILFRQLRQLEALVGEMKEGKLNGGKIIQIRYDSRKRIPRDLDNYDYERFGDYEEETEKQSGKRAAERDPGVNLGGNKLTIVTKDDERLLLQTADGSPWALMPSTTRISLSTLEDFCFSTHEYCANKKQFLGPVPDRQGTQGDFEGQQLNENPTYIHHTGPEKTGAIGTGYHSTNGHSAAPVYGTDESLQSLDPTSNSSPSITKRRKGLGRKKRKREKCYIQKISVPYLMGQHRTFYGSWMQDASPREDFDADKRWLTEHVSGQFLFEYGSVFDLKRGGSHGDTPVKTYQLPYMYDGTNHLVYNGTLLYQRASSPIIVRYDLRTANWTETVIPGAACKGGDYLYSGISYNYFDLASDENGIWLFFHYEKSKTLSVARLHPKTTRIMRIWNLTRFDHTQIGDTWVTCGVMYVLDSRTKPTTFVSIAYDLFRHRSANVSMPWRNTYNKTSMLSYNPLVKKLHIFDNGYLLERNLLIAYPGKLDSYRS